MPLPASRRTVRPLDVIDHTQVDNVEGFAEDVDWQRVKAYP